MVGRTLELPARVFVKGVSHAAFLPAFKTLDDNVRCVPGGPILAQGQSRRLTGSHPRMNVCNPREIAEMPLSAGQQESNGKGRWIVGFCASWMHIPSPIGPITVLLQSEDARFDARECVTDRAAQIPWKSTDWHTHRERCGPPSHIFKLNRGQVQLRQLSTQAALQR